MDRRAALKPKNEGFVYRRDALEQLEAVWLDRLQPYDARGYNARPQLARGTA